MVGWWRKHHPEQTGQVSADLDQLHAEVVDAGADVETREALAGEWRVRLRRLVAADPELIVELQRLLTEQLTPLRVATDQTSEIAQTVTVNGNRNTAVQAGGDIYRP